MTLLIGMAAFVTALYDWGRLAEMDAGAFLLGYAVAGGTLFLAVHDHLTPDGPDPAAVARDEERHQAGREWHLATLELARARTRKKLLECERLERELARECGGGGPVPQRRAEPCPCPN